MVFPLKPLFDKTLAKIFTVPLWFLVVFVQTMLLVNAPIFFGEAAATASEMIMLYLTLTFGFSIMAIFSLKGPALEKVRRYVTQPAIEAMGNFLIFFALGLAILFTLKPFIMLSTFKTFAIGGSIGLTAALPILLLFAVVVSYTEELIFRGIVPGFIGDVLSGFAFALYHLYAYTGGVPAMAFAAAMSFMFVFLREKFDLNASMGFHTAWNLVKLGVLGAA
jgi:membrane protease YdiL (CAAX protease family)